MEVLCFIKITSVLHRCGAKKLSWCQLVSLLKVKLRDVATMLGLELVT